MTQDLFSDCLLLADDFYQYYLGAYSRSPVKLPQEFRGVGDLSGAAATFGGPAVNDIPQFASKDAGEYRGTAGGAFDPVEGSWYVGGVHVNDSYMRLARTIDLSGVTSAQTPQLQAKLSFDTEPGYDNVIVEAHTVGKDDWTTLPEAGGLTSTDVPAECEAGFLLEEHPFLLHYLTLGDACTATGTSGKWNAMTGNSGGWQQATFDLSAYAGKQVEVSISYVTDPSTGGVGAFVDDTKVLVGGAVTESEGFGQVWAPGRYPVHLPEAHRLAATSDVRRGCSSALCLPRTQSCWASASNRSSRRRSAPQSLERHSSTYCHRHCEAKRSLTFSRDVALPAMGAG